jgi:uncharacterized protein YjbI with pentapeptide repeats
MWGGPWDTEERVDLGVSPGWYEGEFRPAINFTRTNLWKADLSNARLEAVNFRGAHLWGTKLRNADLWAANIRRAVLRSADLSGARLSHVIYKRQELAECCSGIQGVESTYGFAILRRDLLDQDFIDSKRALWRTPRWNPGRILYLWPWAFFDYGRSWFRVSVFSLLLITLFGFGYAGCNGIHIHFQHTGPTVSRAFYPWFVASMGFATLGISDMVEPLDFWGQALMIGNVLSGFVTLGLLLSVLSNSFARRA